MSGRIQQLRGAALLAGVIVITIAASQDAASQDAVAQAWAQAVRASWIDPATASRIERLMAGAGTNAVSGTVRGQPSLELITITHGGPSASQALVDSASHAADRLSTWLGPLPGNRLTIVDVPAQASLAGAAYPGIAITSSRLWTTRREFAAERALTVAMARQYALPLANAAPHDSWFAEGLALYVATRGVHEIFEGRYYLTPRFFGGYVPHSLRSILMSPNPLDPRPRVAELAEVIEPADAPWRLAHGEDLARAHRLTTALHTLERFVGWPALQAALRAFFERNTGQTPALQDFTAVLSEQRGADMSWFFDQSMREDARFDYAVTGFISEPAQGRWMTTVDVRRLGEATFDGTNLPRTAGSARSLPVVVRFGDGSEMTEWIDGRDREWRFEYSSTSRALLASVDPGTMLLVDADRTNNTRTLDAPLHTVGLRLAINWLAWLQDAMLTYTAVI